MQTSTLRPGLLVSLKSSTRGNVSYEKTDLEYANEENTELKKWQTERTIADLDEFERAKLALRAAYSGVRKVCTHSAFGLLCPEGDRDELDAAVTEGRRIVDEFNATAELTRIHMYVMVGRIAADDVEAVRAINSEVRDLMADMEKGLKNLDVKTVRDAAAKAKQLGAMLTPQAQGRVQVAVELAREAAKKIVKAGDEATVVIDKKAIRKISEQRVSFLDMDSDVEMQTPKARARVVDLDASVKAASDEFVRDQKRQRKQQLDLED